MKHLLIALAFLAWSAAGEAHPGPSGPLGADFPIRAYHLDLRIQVMPMSSLETFVRQLHDGGINTLIVEFEGTYPYQQHPLIGNRYAYSPAEIHHLVSYCDRLGVDVIPLQQSFGHVEYILRHERYAALREDPRDLSQVCPSKVTQDSLLFSQLYGELAATFHSRYIHIGCDETHLLGHCPICRKKAAGEGVSALYFDYVRMLCNIVIRLGKRPVLWADMALKYPDAIRTLPKGTVLVDWNYGWSLDHFGDHRKLVESGYEVWGAPAIRSSPDDFYRTGWEKHIDNIRDFVPQARRLGYRGIVLTSWSTSGAYSYIYQSENQLSALYPIRRVYPVTGFRLLIQAFLQSIRQTEPLDVTAFVRDYCREWYGFDTTQADKFWDALKEQGAPSDPGGSAARIDELDRAEAAADTLRSFGAPANQGEFAHYLLMADIRVAHLRFLEIQAEANASGASPDSLPALIERLRALQVESGPLDERFLELNKDACYPAELAEENRWRDFEVSDLYERLGRSR